jgi:hypothetical protein
LAEVKPVLGALVEFASLLGLTIPLIAGGVWAVFQFVAESRLNRKQRDRDLTWQRTKFLFEQSEKLANDPDFQEAIRLLADHDPSAAKSTLDDVFALQSHGVASQTIGADAKIIRSKFDKLFSFLDDMYHCYQRDVFTKDEISHFGYILYILSRCEPALRYCDATGFHRVLCLKELVLSASRN